jgi:uncharacterized protein (DUF4415 family)
MTMNENSIKNGWVDPDDAPIVDEAWFEEADFYHGDKLIRRGRPKLADAKKAISLRVDPDVLSWYKSTGDGWQTRMNEALRKAAGI